MIEILILYIVSKHEKTMYAIRKEIIELFGTFTKPSIGTIHPALKRLQANGSLNCLERMSDGGKKSSYYSITPKGREFFKEIFFEERCDNPNLLHGYLQARFATLSMLDIEDRKKFCTEISKSLELYRFEIENKLNDRLLSLDYFQTSLLKRSLSEVKNLQEYVNNIQVDHEC